MSIFNRIQAGRKKVAQQKEVRTTEEETTQARGRTELQQKAVIGFDAEVAAQIAAKQARAQELAASQNKQDQAELARIRAVLKQMGLEE